MRGLFPIAYAGRKQDSGGRFAFIFERTESSSADVGSEFAGRSGQRTQSIEYDPAIKDVFEDFLMQRWTWLDSLHAPPPHSRGTTRPGNEVAHYETQCERSRDACEVEGLPEESKNRQPNPRESSSNSLVVRDVTSTFALCPRGRMASSTSSLRTPRGSPNPVRASAASTDGWPSATLRGGCLPEASQTFVRCDGGAFASCTGAVVGRLRHVA